MEIAPLYGSHSIRMSAGERKNLRRKIVRGGQIADQIRKMATAQHEAQEVPSAEHHLDASLSRNQDTQNLETKALTISANSPHNLSFWKRALSVLKRLLIP